MAKLTLAAKVKQAKLSQANLRAMKLIYELDLGPILACAKKLEIWTAEETREAEIFYRHFLWMCYLNGRRPVPVPTRGADTVWHTHILDTPRYRKDCHAIFRGFLDHQINERKPKPVRRAVSAGTRKMAAELLGTNITPESIHAASQVVPMEAMSMTIWPNSVTSCCGAVKGSIT
jgi:hypothetical protein